MRAKNRVNPSGQQYFLLELEDGRTEIRTNDNSNKIIVAHDIEKLSQAWYYWMTSQPIQVAFEFMSAGEREFLLTGLTPEMWKKLFEEVED